MFLSTCRENTWYVGAAERIGNASRERRNYQRTSSEDTLNNTSQYCGHVKSTCQSATYYHPKKYAIRECDAQHHNDRLYLKEQSTRERREYRT